MSVQQRKNWFEAILTSNTSTLNRLLYLTPDVSAGLQRLEWTMDVAETTPEIKQYCTSQKIDDYMSVCALQLALLKVLTDPGCKPVVSAAKILVSYIPKMHQCFSSADCEALAPLILADKIEDGVISKLIRQKVASDSIRITRPVSSKEVVLVNIPSDTQSEFVSDVNTKVEEESITIESREMAAVQKPVQSRKVEPLDIKKRPSIPVYQSETLAVEDIQSIQDIQVSGGNKDNDQISEKSTNKVVTEDVAASKVPHVPFESEVKELNASQEKSNDDLANLIKQLEPKLLLVDDNHSREDINKSVKFGKSWRGNLEQTLTFKSSASVASNTYKRASIGSRPALESLFTQQNSKQSKVFLKLQNVRGLVLNFNKVPDVVRVFCKVSLRGEVIYQSAPVSFCSQNLYAPITFDEEMAFIAMTGDHVQLSLHAHIVYYKKSNRLLQKSDRFAKREISVAKDIDIGTIKLDDNVLKSSDEISCHKVDWHVKDLRSSRASQFDTRAPSRASSIMEVGQSLFRRLSVRPKSRFSADDTTTDKYNVQISEGGFANFKVLVVEDSSATPIQDVPATMSEAVAWMQQCQWHSTEWYEGFLNQEGGDIKFWRRRFFKLVGAQLQAHHEFTREYRTTIDLTQVVAIEDRPGREYEMMSMSNQFRLVFKHGEVIDFYAENKQEHDMWIRMLQRVLKDLPNAEVETKAGSPVKNLLTISEVNDSEQESAAKRKIAKRVATGFTQKKPSLRREVPSQRNLSPEKVSEAHVAQMFGIGRVAFGDE
ncbi:hypothetical protein MP228_007137 [Amoeboaphelidium protococcarum]|nr:hypothetical protein MP228_007137 [Amoeboaphelidium protococcarum]